ncbi:ROK family protein [Luteipulveratus sp. YIM 133132]|uniref:ROK family protein n=1 Tax=Luteipulveratus flavus TaxID=3031728 RepID=UPI0023AED255|nr:ROK family protein [Luteipulveratus sp. YIM 133132]MDE9367290.1 ROK family protein [Luteipulveratus sp. YIM 133132]
MTGAPTRALPRTVVGVDIGGTKTCAAVIDDTGVVLARSESGTPGPDGRKALLHNVVERINEVIRVTGAEPLAVGVGAAGVIDSRAGVVVSSTDVLKGWAGTPVAAELRRATGLPTTVDNDVHAHALGEVWRGAAKGVDQVLYVAVGTGVGASWVHRGWVRHGARNAAGHLGHVPAPDASGLRCVCGGEGHLEAIAAGPAICRAVTRRTGAPFDRLQDVVRRALEGPGPARDELLRGAHALGSVVGGAVNLLDPDMVVLGGGVVAAGDVWWQPMLEALRRELLPATRDVAVVPSSLGADAALVGAARLAWRSLDG